MRRIPQLDGLRGVAILMVFLYHAFGVHLFWSGVDLFFVLSGYLITGILFRLKDREKWANAPSGIGYWREFYLRRARRILPPYFLFLLMVGLFFQIPWSRVWYFYGFFGANIASAMDRVPEIALIPLWSLAVEEQFYLVWPFIVRVVNVSTLKKIAIGVIVAVPAIRAVCTPLFHSRWPIYVLPFFRADALAWGALISVLEYDRPAWASLSRRSAWMIALAAGSILGALSAFRSFRLNANSIPFNAVGYTLIGILCAGLLAYALGARDGFVLWILTRGPLRYLGKVSYTFYLYHFGVLKIVEEVPNSHGRSIVAFLITLAIAATSWELLESPILKRSPKAKTTAAYAG